MQTISLGNPFINLKGEWKKDQEYEYLDAVTNRGSLFIANKKFVPAGAVPGKNEAWVLSARGEDEEQKKEQIESILSEHTKIDLKDGAHGLPSEGGEEGQVLTVKNNGLAWETVNIPKVRTRITKNTTFYVRTDGNDANDGSADTKDKAFKTIQAAIDYVCTHIDVGINKVTIQVGTGTFAGFAANYNRISIPYLVVSGKSDGSTILSNKENRTKDVLINTYGMTQVALQNLVLTFDDSYVPTTDTCRIIRNANGCYLFFDSNITIKANIAKNNMRIIHNYSNAKIRHNSNVNMVIDISNPKNKTINVLAVSSNSELSFDSNVSLQLSGAVTSFASVSHNSAIHISNVKFSGTLTGKKYTVESNSILDVKGKGPSFIPCTADGVLTSGGTLL